MIGIMAAMHEELSRIVTMLEKVTEEKVGRKLIYLGTLNNKKVVVVFSGWGKVAAATTSTMLVERYAITQLIFTGVAGAIQTHLNIGDVIIGKTFVQHDMDCAGVLVIQRFELPLLSITEIPSTESLQIKAEKAASHYISDDLVSDIDKKELKQFEISQPAVYSGLIASGDQFISSLEKQHELSRALPSLLAVEMEGAAVAQVAYEYQLPFIVIRIISDNANHDAIIDFPRFIDQLASHFTAGIIKRLVL